MKQIVFNIYFILQILVLLTLCIFTVSFVFVDLHRNISLSIDRHKLCKRFISYFCQLLFHILIFSHSTLYPVVCRTYVLITLFVFISEKWCPIPIVFLFFFLRLVYLYCCTFSFHVLSKTA